MDPRLVYQNNGPYQRPSGTFNYKLVSTEDELSEALAGGWYATLPEAIAQSELQQDAAEAALDAKFKLAEEAIGLGIKIDGRWSSARLQEEIEAKKSQ